MPSAVRGDVHRYDFGPIVGNELSSYRPALIVSNTEFNRRLSLAIAAPTSTSAPQDRYVMNHVGIESTRSWASARQIKSVEQEKLGAKLGEATPEELEEVLEVIATRLWRTPLSPGFIQTPSGHERCGTWLYIQRGVL